MSTSFLGFLNARVQSLQNVKMDDQNQNVGSNVIISVAIVEIKYVNSNNFVVHTENCKLQLIVGDDPKEFARNINMCGIDDCFKRFGSTDFGVDIFFVDYIEEGNQRKAHFIVRTKDQLKMFKMSTSNWFLILGEGDRSTLATMRTL